MTSLCLLENFDKELYGFFSNTFAKQNRCLSFIPDENATSPVSACLMGKILVNASEKLTLNRQESLENLTCKRICKLFGAQKTSVRSLNGKPLTLSPMEYKMLNLFRKNPRQVLTRGQLLEKLWDIDERFVDEHTLTTSISRIRSKIESDGGAPYIKTVYGMGYQWTGGEAK